MRKYREYSDQDIINNSKNVKSIAGLLKSLNLAAVGGNYKNIKRLIQKLNIDTSHWTGQGWNKDQRTKDWSKYTKAFRFKKHLISEKGHKCESCDLTHWKKELISLEIHHIDGDASNNEKNNLQLLCPNCHSLTDNYRGRKNKSGDMA